MCPAVQGGGGGGGLTSKSKYVVLFRKVGHSDLLMWKPIRFFCKAYNDEAQRSKGL